MRILSACVKRFVSRTEDRANVQTSKQTNKYINSPLYSIRCCSVNRYQMSEETEKRKNTDVLYEKTKEQLTRKEEQCLQSVYSHILVSF